MGRQYGITAIRQSGHAAMTEWSDTPLIRAVGLSKTYTLGRIQVPAVRDVHLTVPAGRLVVIMGPSGSGKTTLLSMLGCILRPTAGELYIAGQRVERWDEAYLPYIRRRYIGFVFQQFNLLRALTALENVEIALHLRGIRGRAARRRAAEALAQVGLADRQHFYPKDLSGGEQQRVAIARALVANPLILLADEPTANLDSGTGQHVVEYLRSATYERRMATVVVTHDHRIMALADEVYSMEDGCLRRVEKSAWSSSPSSWASS
jgi:putative ABC transport system ATP-binding protein